MPAPAFERKILAPADVARWAARLARPLVFTNGVFDVLHRGHATYLARARSLGAALLVALNGDASARRLGKGPGRPVNALEDRMALVAALESVDAVTWFDEDTPAALIAACARRFPKLCPWQAGLTYRRFISLRPASKLRSATQPAGTPSASASSRRPPAGAYSPGNAASSCSKLVKQQGSFSQSA